MPLHLSRSALFVSGLALFAAPLACSSAEPTLAAEASPEAAEEETLSIPTALGRWSGSYSAAAGEVRFAAEAPTQGGLAPQAFGERTSDNGDGTAELTVTSDAFRRDEECPAPAADQLCVRVTIRNNKPYLVRNVYLQLTSLTPNEPSRFGARNSDAILPDHVGAIAAPGSELGLWYFGHIPPGGSKQVQAVFHNPMADFNFTAATYGDAATRCRRTGPADRPSLPFTNTELERVLRDTNCDGVLGDASSAVFVDGARGSDVPCAVNPIAAEYPDDESQGVLGCGNGTLRRPFATLSAALARRGERRDVYVGSSGWSTRYEEPTTLRLPDGVSLFGGYDRGDGFVTRYFPYGAQVVVGARPALETGRGSRVELLFVRSAR